MAKPKQSARYVCQECGGVHSKWAGKCEACGAWNSIVEEAVAGGGFTRLSTKADAPDVQFSDLSAKSTPVERKTTGISELDRVLGGGLVEGSAILIGGDPGIGKSTLLLQLAAQVAQDGMQCSYITGEESVEQVRLRAVRLGVAAAPVHVASATSVSGILEALAKHKSKLVVIDSIQTMYVDTVESAPGTVSQLRAAAHELITFAKQHGATLVLVGHVTKDGQIAGPKVLEHMVDTVLYFEGERGHQFRILRAVKNRFGAANEIGVFEMQGSGLAEVANPSSLFVSGKAGQVSGSVIFAGLEGTRPVLVEIQALVSPSPMSTPRRAVVGWDSNRLAMLLAVLQVRCGVMLHDKEVYLNVVGGMRISEPAADLAAAAAIISSIADVPLKPGCVIFGEIGLSGEVRPVGQALSRLKEAKKLGFSSAITPDETGALLAKENALKGFILQEIKYIRQLRGFLAGE